MPVSQRKAEMSGTPGAGVCRADRIGRPPAPAAHDEQVGHRRRRGIGTKRRQVLIGERVADERIVAALIAAAAEGAKGRRNPAGLDVERVIEPRADADVGRVRPDDVEVFGPDFADDGERLTGRQDADSATRNIRSVLCS